MTTSAATIDPKAALGPCRPASKNITTGLPVLGAVIPVDAFKPCIEVQGEHNIRTHALQIDRGRGRGCVGEKEERGREGERGNEVMPSFASSALTFAKSLVLSVPRVALICPRKKKRHVSDSFERQLINLIEYTRRQEVVKVLNLWFVPFVLLDGFCYRWQKIQCIASITRIH
jgi:hypothetical protein